MRKIVLFIASVSVVVAGGCAHSQMRGSVAMKATNDEVHVCMGNKEVKAGDRVAFFINNCQSVGRETTYDICTKIKLGEGTVLRALNEHYSVVKPDSGMGAKIGEGTVVEKL